jgi:galactokinase
MTASVEFHSDLERLSLAERFNQLFSAEPRIFRAPGRVNLIGEHTDYNAGFVMPAAIGFFTSIAIAARNDRKLLVHSTEFSETVELPLDELTGPPRRHWSDYVRGVAAVLQSRGYSISPATLMIESDVPLGAGLSSSAALEVSTALALTSLIGMKIAPLDLARLCQRAEHEYTGTLCGIMDQFVATFGREGHAILLDCRSLEPTFLPVPDDVRIVICNSMVKHDLAAGEYNRRRADCEAGVEALRRYLPGITALRDVEFDQLERYRSELSERVYRRCRHVVTEDQRVLDAAAALRRDDLAGYGRLMYESHASLRDDYEVSCPELDVLVELASTIDGVYGARMTGGGFGGCTVNLVRADCAAEFSSRIAARYQERTQNRLPVYICSAAEGAGAVGR